MLDVTTKVTNDDIMIHIATTPEALAIIRAGLSHYIADDAYFSKEAESIKAALTEWIES